LGGVELAPEVLLRNDVGRVLRPAARKLDVELLEHRLRRVADPSVAKLPLDLVERVHIRPREAALYGQASIRGVDAAGRSMFCASGHALSFRSGRIPLQSPLRSLRGRDLARFRG